MTPTTIGRAKKLAKTLKRELDQTGAATTLAHAQGAIAAGCGAQDWHALETAFRRGGTDAVWNAVRAIDHLARHDVDRDQAANAVAALGNKAASRPRAQVVTEDGANVTILGRITVSKLADGRLEVTKLTANGWSPSPDDIIIDEHATWEDALVDVLDEALLAASGSPRALRDIERVASGYDARAGAFHERVGWEGSTTPMTSIVGGVLGIMSGVAAMGMHKSTFMGCEGRLGSSYDALMLREGALRGALVNVVEGPDGSPDIRLTHDAAATLINDALLGVIDARTLELAGVLAKARADRERMATYDDPEAKDGRGDKTSIADYNDAVGLLEGMADEPDGRIALLACVRETPAPLTAKAMLFQYEQEMLEWLEDDEASIAAWRWLEQVDGDIVRRYIRRWKEDHWELPHPDRVARYAQHDPRGFAPHLLDADKAVRHLERLGVDVIGQVAAGATRTAGEEGALDAQAVGCMAARMIDAHVRIAPDESIDLSDLMAGGSALDTRIDALLENDPHWPLVTDEDRREKGWTWRQLRSPAALWIADRLCDVEEPDGLDGKYGEGGYHQRIESHEDGSLASFIFRNHGEHPFVHAMVTMARGDGGWYPHGVHGATLGDEDLEAVIVALIENLDAHGDRRRAVGIPAAWTDRAPLPSGPGWTTRPMTTAKDASPILEKISAVVGLDIMARIAVDGLGDGTGWRILAVDASEGSGHLVIRRDRVFPGWPMRWRSVGRNAGVGGDMFVEHEILHQLSRTEMDERAICVSKKEPDAGEVARRITELRAALPDDAAQRDTALAAVIYEAAHILYGIAGDEEWLHAVLPDDAVELQGPDRAALSERLAASPLPISGIGGSILAEQFRLEASFLQQVNLPELLPLAWKAKAYAVAAIRIAERLALTGATMLTHDHLVTLVIAPANNHADVLIRAGWNAPFPLRRTVA